MTSRPAPDNWVEWGPTDGSFVDVAYGNGRWATVRIEGTSSPLSTKVYTNEDARNTDQWTLTYDLTSISSASGTYQIGLHFGGGVWAMMGSGYITYSRDNWATVSRYALSTTANFQSFKWQYDRWLRISSGTVYQATDIAGPWTTLATTASLGFTPVEVAYNGQRFVVARSVPTNTTTSTPVVKYSEDGGASWTTWDSRTNNSISTTLYPRGLSWYEDQQEWAILWGPGGFNNTFAGSPRWVSATGSTWTAFPNALSSTSVMIAGVTGNGWQLVTYRSNQTGGSEPQTVYRFADSWGTDLAWTSPPGQTSSNLYPRGITAGPKYGDGYWVAVHDNAPGTNFNTRDRVVASPEIDDSYWGISLDDWN